MKVVLIDRKVEKGATGFLCHFSTGICSPKGQNQMRVCWNSTYLTVGRENIGERLWGFFIFLILLFFN